MPGILKLEVVGELIPSLLVELAIPVAVATLLFYKGADRRRYTSANGEYGQGFVQKRSAEKERGLELGHQR